MLTLTERGLFSQEGQFHIDPWQAADHAVITHAHGDHAVWGCASYLCSRECEPVLRARVAPDAAVESLKWGEQTTVNGVTISFHPAGHILGSAQVRVHARGETWVVSGDYKTEVDSTCTAFESVRCDTFITESTFGLPIYRWKPQSEIFSDIRAWWRTNRDDGRASILFAYALGKAQRLLAGLRDADIGPIYTHGAVERLNAVYRASGVAIADTIYAGSMEKGTSFAGSLIVAPPSAAASPWLRRFGESSTAFASGWMQIRGARRRRALDRGFALSDHVDWPSLLSAIEATGAPRVWVTHGYREPVTRWLEEHGIEAVAIASRWEGEEAADAAVASAEEAV